MSDPPRVPHNPAELVARRRRAQERRRRRRFAWLGGVMLAAAVVAVAVALGSGGGSAGAARTQTVAVTTTHVAKVAHHTGPKRTKKVIRRHARASAAAAERALELKAIRRTIADNDYVSKGSARHKLIALTFDDGPGPSTPGILKWLKAHHVPATFFLVGANARAQPALVRAEAAAGDAIGDHTESHAFLGHFGEAGQHGEIADGAEAITSITGQRVRLFRPPYGSFNPTTQHLLRDAGLLMVLWTVDTEDYAKPGVDRIVFTALSGARGGSIVLMHDGGGDRSETLAALPRIVHRLRLRGYKLVTVPALLVGDPVPANQPPPHSLAGG